MSPRKLGLVACCALLLAACGGGDGNGGGGTNDSALVEQGEGVFQQNCSHCHGIDLRGTGAGPPLLHPFYAPNHHADQAFYSAVRNGVKAHHWEFGDMPPVQGITDDEIAAVVAYVRATQESEGIEEDPSH
jgi:mono/diheme cytochrome c family protein